jgi:hypothetical protein
MEPENRTRSNNFVGKSRTEKAPCRVDFDMRYAFAGLKFNTSLRYFSEVDFGFQFANCCSIRGAVMCAAKSCCETSHENELNESHAGKLAQGLKPRFLAGRERPKAEALGYLEATAKAGATTKAKCGGSLHCAAHDEIVNRFGRDDDFWGLAPVLSGCGLEFGGLDGYRDDGV